MRVRQADLQGRRESADTGALMGNAKARGTFEQRKQQAIDEGRAQPKCECGHYHPKIYTKPGGRQIWACCGKPVEALPAVQEPRP